MPRVCGQSKRKLNEEKSKGALHGLAQQNGFGPTFFHEMLSD
jgi:hypothetical protein